MGHWTWEVARRIAHFCDVLVCGPRLNHEPAFEECETVRFASFAIIADVYLFKVAKRLKRKQSAPPDYASHFYRGIFARRVAWALRSQGCEVIHILNLAPFIPIMRRLNPRSRIVLHMECDWLAGLDREALDGQLRGADAIIGCSDYITEAIRRRFPHYAAKCRTIYNGVDPAEFAPGATVEEADGRPRVIFANRISPEKGLHVLLDAFTQVLAKQPGATLEIAGPDASIPLEAITSLKDNPVVNSLARFYQGNYSEQMRQRVRDDAVLRDRVTFAGPVPHSLLAGRIAQADILVQPSVFDEPFGIQIVEAMASGLPVIGSSAGGIPELILDGRTGILVDRDNPVALAGAMLRLMENPALAKAMGGAGRRRAEEKFSWERVMDDLHSCYFEPSIRSDWRTSRM